LATFQLQVFVINMIIILDIIHRHKFVSKHDFSESGSVFVIS
jgi:hypothetical protein